MKYKVGDIVKFYPKTGFSAETGTIIDVGSGYTIHNIKTDRWTFDVPQDAIIKKLGHKNLIKKGV